MRHGTEFARAMDRDVRMLSLFVAASVILHLIVAVALPRLRGSADAPPQPLEVTLEKREPPPVVLPEPVPPPAVPPRVPPPSPKAKPAEQKKIAQPEPDRTAVRPTVPPPVLALPPAPDTPQMSAAVPQGEEKPAVTAREEKPPQTPPAASPARPEPPVATKEISPVWDAAYLRNPRPLYPMSARRRGEEGTVLLKVLITREGIPASVSIEKSSGSTSLDEAALEAVRKWRFVPGRRGAEAVEVWHLVPIVFNLKGAS